MSFMRPPILCNLRFNFLVIVLCIGFKQLTSGNSTWYLSFLCAIKHFAYRSYFAMCSNVFRICKAFRFWCHALSSFPSSGSIMQDTAFCIFMLYLNGSDSTSTPKSDAVKAVFAGTDFSFFLSGTLKSPLRIASTVLVSAT